MSIQILKSGIIDTVQDKGRFGFRHLGINVSGVMDSISSQAVNMLVGNESNEAVIEMHFPTPTILFERETLIAIGGADFSATLNGDDIPLLHPILACKNSVLQFHKKLSGNLCYLAVRGGFKVPKWLKSKSTNMKAIHGGYNGRSLLKGDMIKIKTTAKLSKEVCEKDFIILPWQVDLKMDKSNIDEIIVLKGPEWDFLDDVSKKTFCENSYIILPSSDRMGYRLKGSSLNCKSEKEIISSAVCFGTIQLLPDRKLIVLMADHQTTGGYPRIAQVANIHLSKLAQKGISEKIKFKILDITETEELLVNQDKHLTQLKNACNFKLIEYFDGQ